MGFKQNNKQLSNRHHFKNIEFKSSLTNHTYKSSTNEKGTLSIFDVTTGEKKFQTMQILQKERL